VRLSSHGEAPSMPPPTSAWQLAILSAKSDKSRVSGAGSRQFRPFSPKLVRRATSELPRAKVRILRFRLVGSLLAVKQLAKCVLTIAGAGTRLGGFSGGASVTHEPGVARRNLGPVLLYERRPDGLFQTFHLTKWFWRDPATQARKAASAESRRRTVSRDSGQNGLNCHENPSKTRLLSLFKLKIVHF